MKEGLLIPNFSCHDKKKGICFPETLTEDLAEFVGLHIGDGHLGHRMSKDSYLFQIGGNAKTDSIHYDNFIVPLIRRLFNISVKPKLLSGGSVYGFQIYSKGLFQFLKENFNLPTGSKKNITIPEVVSKDNNLLAACLRGVIDTDFFFSYNSKGPELSAWFGSKSLVKSLEVSFLSLGFEPLVYYDIDAYHKKAKKFYRRHKITIRKKRDIEKWIKEIGTHHPKFRQRYTEWKKSI